MILKLKNNKINIVLLIKKMDKFKSFKFRLDPINEGICFIKKRFVSTYFFCQKVDIIFTDCNNVVLKIEKAVPSEKILISPKDTKFVYILKLNSDIVNVHDKLKIIYQDNEKELIDLKLR